MVGRTNLNPKCTLHLVHSQTIVNFHTNNSRTKRKLFTINLFNKKYVFDWILRKQIENGFEIEFALILIQFSSAFLKSCVFVCRVQRTRYFSFFCVHVYTRALSAKVKGTNDKVKWIWKRGMEDTGTRPDYLVNRDDKKIEGPFGEKNCTEI